MELEPDVAARICRALVPVLTSELGEPVNVKDISVQQERWDFEAVSRLNPSVLRRISHTRAVSENQPQAESEMWDDIVPAVEEHLEQLQVRDLAICLHGHELPKNKEHRRDLGRMLAERIAALPSREVLELSDLVGSDASAVHDKLFKAFNDITVQVYPIGRSSVVSASDDRLWGWVPPLSRVVLPVIERKLDKHGSRARGLTLVIQLMNHEIVNDESLAEVRAGLSERSLGFRSLYLARERYPSRDFEIYRIY